MVKTKLFLITKNKNKYQEASLILKPYRISLEQKPLSKEEIQAESLEKIALHAARKAYVLLRRPLIVDDSGLFVEALRGFPGPYSSYVYKTIGYEGILDLLDDVENRRACFKTALALISPPLEKLFVGETCGVITRKPMGSGGFGFDPIFMPEGYSKTYAQMTTTEKNAVSHRGKAFRLMASWLAGRRVYPSNRIRG